VNDPTTAERLLHEARAQLTRLSPAEAHAAAREGALLIDIRSESQRAQDGTLPDARFIARNVLEWRLDPASPHRDPECAKRDLEVILICNEGYQSSLGRRDAQALRHRRDRHHRRIPGVARGRPAHIARPALSVQPRLRWGGRASARGIARAFVRT
jgi:rhodanese-related sulfurtransferase